MFCGECGSAIAPGQKFCGGCGVAIAGAVAPPPSLPSMNQPASSPGNNSPMSAWYWRLTNEQRIFMWIVSGLLVPFYGVGLIPLAVLTFIRLGSAANVGRG